MKKISFAFIGGSGLYKIPGFKNYKWKKISSNFGLPSSEICIGQLHDQNIAFLPRHGRNHTISPSNINYRANIEILKKIGVESIFSLSAVGSLREDYVPGDFVVVDQFIDKTFLRNKTFFDNDLIVHLPMYKPVCDVLRKNIINALTELKSKFHKTGTYICIEGPQFSSLAESQLYRSWGCDIIGMTNMPEAKLALEAGISYASVGMVTDFDCWHPNHDNVTVEQIVATLKENSEKAFELINLIVKKGRVKINTKVQNLSKSSIITDTKHVKKETIKKLKHILS